MTETDPANDEPVAVPDDAAEPDQPDEAGEPDQPDEAGGPDLAGDAGAPNLAGDDAPVRALAVGLNEAALGRLSESGGVDATTDRVAAGEVDLVLVSTRLPRREALSAVRSLAGEVDCPIVVLVHTGGESLAVDTLRAGATAMVAEGNEQGVRAVVTAESNDTALLDTYDRQLGQSRVRVDAAAGRDPITHLPGKMVFSQRLEDLGKAGDIPRVGIFRVPALDDVLRRLSHQAGVLLRRRLAVQCGQLARRFDVESYALGPSSFGLLGLSWSPDDAEELGRCLGLATELFAPAAVPELWGVLGHAGSEVTGEWAELVEFAERAADAAAADGGSGVVGAETLSLGVSSTTEFETVRRMVAFVEQHDRHEPGHGDRVTQIAADLAYQLGYDGQTVTRMRLAALLHDIGKVSLPTEVIAGPDGLDDDALVTYRSHPERGAALLRVSAGEEVAAAVRGHHERWDGEGYPDGLAGEDIPIAARIVAVANAFDVVCHPVRGRGLSDQEAVAALTEESGTRFDPSVAAALAEVVEAGRGTRVGAA